MCFVGFGMLRSCSCGGLWPSGMLVLLGRLFGCFGWFTVFGLGVGLACAFRLL